VRRRQRAVAVAAVFAALVGGGSVARALTSSAAAHATAGATRLAPPASAGATSASASRAASAAAPPRAPLTAAITIPLAGVRGLRTVLYPGAPDDARGTAYEEQGLAAVPTGPLGGVLPGRIGNLVVTAHRTAAGGPFRRVPALPDGAHVYVRWAGRTYDYVVVDRFRVTFHDPASYALQVAPVPGHPGATPTKAMVTLSTCATPEDNALGLRQRDALGNPPHRLDVVAVLVAVR
jgi:sortase A